METHTEISRQNSNLFSAEQVAKAIGTDLETVNKWIDVGAVDRATFGGGQFSRYELHRVALVFELEIWIFAFLRKRHRPRNGT